MNALRGFALCSAACVALASQAQSLATYEGADRMEKIVAAAKKEGELTLYTTIAEKDLPAIIGPFEKKTGIKVTVWRAGTDKVLQRAIAEIFIRSGDLADMPELPRVLRTHRVAPAGGGGSGDLIDVLLAKLPSANAP